LKLDRRGAASYNLRMPAKKTAKPKQQTVEERWTEYERALIVTAHPDDAEFMAGGTIAKLCDMGLEVTLAIATSGDKGTRDPNLRPQELAAIREAEQRAAAAVLGLHLCVFLGYPDGFLVEGPELRGHVVRLIRTLQPDIIVTWDGFREGFNHTDHRVVGRVVRDALYPAAHDPHYYAEFAREGIGPWRTAEALFAATNEPNHHVDIAPYLERKLDAILCHTSQVDGASKDEWLKRWRERAKRDREGRKRTGFEHAESFKRVEFRRPPGAPGSPGTPPVLAVQLRERARRR
jgi:LmbE family N-acetylglucosaminyl deacetylase